VNHDPKLDLATQSGRRARKLNGEPGKGFSMDERGRTLAGLVRDVSRLYTAVGQKELAPWGITMAHWYYLRALEEGPLNQLELSKRVGMASTTAVPALDFLEGQGLVVRTRDPHDRRKYNVSLTDNAERLVNSVMKTFVCVIGNSLNGVQEKEIKLVWKILSRVESNLLALEGSDVP
jgi:DNA-binding MarR family transcriptional regulator